MTRKEAKRRLRFIAEWWEPDVMGRTENGTGLCVIEAAANAIGTAQATERLGLSDCFRIWGSWDSGNRAAALRAIEEL